MALYGFDAYSPVEISERIQQLGVIKARLPLRQMVMLGILAGAFIGLGAMYYVLISSDASLGFATSRVLGGVAFSLGLLLVVVAGAELFTGNNLLAMAWADGRISSTELLRSWAVVCVANLIGAIGVALMVWLSGYSALNEGRIGERLIIIYQAKLHTPLIELFWRAVLCNILVCLAIWMAMAGRSVSDKLAAIVLPVSAFVAAGFEHSVANMFLLPLGMLLKYGPPDWYGIARNLLIVIAGNLVGGSGLVALVYYIIYRNKDAK